MQLCVSSLNLCVTAIHKRIVIQSHAEETQSCTELHREIKGKEISLKRSPNHIININPIKKQPTNQRNHCKNEYHTNIAQRISEPLSLSFITSSSALTNHVFNIFF